MCAQYSRDILPRLNHTLVDSITTSRFLPSANITRKNRSISLRRPRRLRLTAIVPRLWSLIDSPMTLTESHTTSLFYIALRRYTAQGYTHTRDVHRKIAGRVVATATRRRPRQPGWSTERDILRIGRRSLHTRFRMDPQAETVRSRSQVHSLLKLGSRFQNLTSTLITRKPSDTATTKRLRTTKLESVHLAS